jgi:hypothetical protein
MRNDFVLGWLIIALGTAFMIVPARIHLLDRSRRDPETQSDPGDFWVFDETAWRQGVVFFIGGGVITAGIYLLNEHAKQKAALSRKG